jgi:hypothetical protein
MPTIPRTPSLAQVIQLALDRRCANLHVAVPARVERYDSAKQQIDAQPLVKDRYTDDEDEVQTERLPVVTNVPLVFPGAGPWAVVFPVAVGDTVLLVFSDASLDVWLAQGGEVDPLDMRRHHLSDAVAIPGLRPFSAPLPGAGGSTMVIGKPGDPTDAVALAAKVDQALTNVKAWLTTHTHAGVTVGSGVTGVSAAPPPSTPATGSSTVKVSQ